MRRYNRAGVLAAIIFIFCQVYAQNNETLTRDEVTVIKKKLVSALDALGKPPAGYGMERESFSLPTDAYKPQGGSRYSPIYGSATREFGSEKATESANKDFEKEYQKKMLEAQAKGDYEAMAKLGQEMQKKASEMQLKAVDAKKEPINVNVNLNSNPGATIDPDAVVFEKAGVIALRTTSDPTSEKGDIHVYFDPVSLKETKQLSKVDLKQPEGGVTKRTTVLSITIHMSGPTKEIEGWAKRIETGKVLAQIDGAR